MSSITVWQTHSTVLPKVYLESLRASVTRAVEAMDFYLFDGGRNYTREHGDTVHRTLEYSTHDMPAIHGPYGNWAGVGGCVG